MRTRAPAGSLSLGIIVAYLVAFADPARACTCVAAPGGVAWPALDQAAQDSDAVFVGRLLARTALSDSPPYDGNDIAFVELVVVDAVKGLAPGARVRVWDAGFGSSCTRDLRPLQIGALVAMALVRAGTETREYFERVGLDVAPDDYLVRSCGDYLKLLESDREAGRVATRLRRAVLRASKGRK